MDRSSAKLATIECGTCSALIEVYRRDEPEYSLFWESRSDGFAHCQHGAVERCPQAGAEVRLRFPDPPSDRER